MRLFIGSAAALLLSVAVGVSAASEEASGTVEEIDETERTITLDDGTTYYLQDGVMLEDISVGHDVTVAFEEQQGDRIAHEVAVAED